MASVPPPGDGVSPYNRYVSAAANNETLQSQKAADNTTGPIKSAAALIAAVVLLLCFACSIAACVTDAFTLKVNRGSVKATLWEAETCVNGAGCATADYPEGSWCTEKQVRFEYLQVASILLTVFAVVAVVVAVAETLGILPRLATAGAVAWVWFWLLLQWALMASAFHYDYCGTTSMRDQGFKLSTSFALYLCQWLVLSIAGVYYMIARLQSS